MLHKILHLEPTDACNAACPQCPREILSSFDKNQLHHLTVNQIKNLISKEQIQHLDKMFMCGDFGDPAAGKHTLEIYRYFRELNPTITLGMNTNGSLRSTKWWRELAEILNQSHDYVVFSIDGLEDTNHIYRINTKWHKIMQSAQSFIDAGGSAHWDMLIFEHNEHQINQAQNLAQAMGFKWFRAKVSKRNVAYPVSFLNPPKGWKDPIVTNGVIECPVLKEQSIYISANGKTYPCCWLGGDTNFTLDKFDQVQESWGTNTPVTTCVEHCSKNIIGTSFSNQWQKEIEFK